MNEKEVVLEHGASFIANEYSLDSVLSIARSSSDCLVWSEILCTFTLRRDRSAAGGSSGTRRYVFARRRALGKFLSETGRGHTCQRAEFRVRARYRSRGSSNELRL